MSKNVKDDEIPLTISLPAISETKAKFEALLRAAMDREIKDKKKEKKGVEERRKSGKQQSKLAHSSSLERPEAAEDGSQTYGSSSQLLSSDTDVPSSKEEKAAYNTLKTNKHSQDQKKKHTDLKASPEKNGLRNGRKTEVGKRTTDGSPSNAILDTRKLRESCEGENCSDSVDDKCVFKKPVPLPRIKTKTHTKIVTTDNVNYKSEEETSSDTHKTLIVEALVSASDATPSSHVRNEFPGTGKGSRRLELQNSEEIQMAEMDLSGKRPSVTTRQALHQNSKKRERTKGKHIYSSEEEDIVVDSALDNASSNVDSPLKEKNGDHSECIGVGNEPALSSNYNYEKIVGIFVHQSDSLQPDPLVRHPLVKVHLLCADTGQYLKKSSLGRSVSFFYENKTVDYILPQMTETCDFRRTRSILPSWEELIVFNEDIEYILNPDLSVVIMFEILDFVSFPVASARYKKLGTEGGWYRIAWAFLKPVGKNGTRNTEKKVRLQLYKPHKSHSFSCESCEPYVWWSTGQWDQYPCSLYVTVKGIHPPDNLQPALRSCSALQSEHSTCRINIEPAETERELESSATTSLPANETVLPSQSPDWSRLPSQSCKVPNKRAFTFATPSRGCFSVKFSPSGLFLACAVISQDTYTIVVLTIPEGKDYVQLAAHQGLIYDLQWSHDDAFLLSASADCTVCIWDMCNKKLQPIHMLPHPSFVYCAQFHPTNNSILITGCCDSVVRVWTKPKKSMPYDLSQELEKHAGFVNTLCFDRHCRLFSGNSEGQICMWNSAQKQTRHPSDWELKREICVRELRSTVINKLVAHPGGQRLLVHARDSLLRMLDVGTGSVIQWFKGSLNHRVQTSACITPCGSLVWAASEDGTVCVWNADTGEQAATYTALGFNSASTGVDYHPWEHMVTFCSYGSASQVVVCDHDKSSSGRELGLQVCKEGSCSDGPQQTAAALQPISLPALVQLPSSGRHVDVYHSGGSEWSRDYNSAPLSNSLSEHANSNGFVLHADSLHREKRLANILEKIDQVLSLPSVRHSPANSSNSSLAGK